MNFNCQIIDDLSEEILITSDNFSTNNEQLQSLMHIIFASTKEKNMSLNEKVQEILDMIGIKNDKLNEKICNIVSSNNNWPSTLFEKLISDFKLSLTFNPIILTGEHKNDLKSFTNLLHKMKNDGTINFECELI
jgi:hypothetical protein